MNVTKEKTLCIIPRFTNALTIRMSELYINEVKLFNFEFVYQRKLKYAELLLQV